MITFVLAVLWLATQPVRPVPARPAVCPGALYFIRHDAHASWTRHKRLLCRIGAHDFYRDK